MASQIIYGRRPVAEAERGRRRVHRLWRAPQTPAAELEGLCGSPDHQGVVAEVDAYPYAKPNALLQAKGGLIVALDQVQDPRNLGAVAARPSSPAPLVWHSRAAVRPRLRPSPARHRRGRSSTSRSPVFATWRIGSREAKESGFWIWGAAPGADRAPWDVDLRGPTVLVLGGEGSGIRPRVEAACDGLIALPKRGEVSSLNVSAAAAALLFEALRQR